MTALHLTAYFGLKEAASNLLENQEYRDVRDSDGRTPLSWQQKTDTRPSCSYSSRRVPPFSQETIMGERHFPGLQEMDTKLSLSYFLEVTRTFKGHFQLSPR